MNQNKTFCHGGEPNIVVVGGGTGLSTMLRGLKQYTENITAVVSVADDGGGSGILRRELHMLPPGDIRSCILALSKTEPVMEKLLRYRFQNGSLKGQNFGNLFLAAMNEIFDGDFVTAVKNVSSVLRVRGKVLPVTATDVELVARMENGQSVVGESRIGTAVHRCGCRIERVSLRAKNKASGAPRVIPEVTEALRQADLIVLGPGSLYTSILPNLVVPGFLESVRASGAPVLYINNIMTQPGETDGYTAFDHAEAILAHTAPDFIDHCIVNCQTVDTPLLSRYMEQDSEVVALDEARFQAAGIHLVRRELVGIVDERYIRHNTEVLADAICDVLTYISREDVSEEGVRLYHPGRDRR